MSDRLTCGFCVLGRCRAAEQDLWGSKTGHRLLTCKYYCIGGSRAGNIADL
jgi:hypothetical protein